MIDMTFSDVVTITIPADGRLYVINGRIFLPMMSSVTLYIRKRAAE